MSLIHNTHDADDFTKNTCNNGEQILRMENGVQIHIFYDFQLRITLILF